MTACETIGPELTAYLQGELGVAARRVVREHIAVCPACERELAELREVLTLAGRIEPLEPSPDFHHALNQRIKRLRRAELRASRRAGASDGLAGWREELRCLLAFVRYRVVSSGFVRAHLVAVVVLGVFLVLAPWVLDGGTRPRPAPASETGPVARAPAGSTAVETSGASSQGGGREDGAGGGVTRPSGEDDLFASRTDRPAESGQGSAAKEDVTTEAPGHRDTGGDAGEVIPAHRTDRLTGSGGGGPPREADVDRETLPGRAAEALFVGAAPSSGSARRSIDAENRLLVSRYRMMARLDPLRRAHRHSPAGDLPEVEEAIERGLMWLAREQTRTGRRSGSWDMLAGAGERRVRVGTAALGLLAFVADGQTEATGRQRLAVARTVDFLRRSQDPEGLFGPVEGDARLTLYNHTLAFLALTRHYILRAGRAAAEADRKRLETALARLDELLSGYPLGDSPCSWQETVWFGLAAGAAQEAGLGREREGQPASLVARAWSLPAGADSTAPLSMGIEEPGAAEASREGPPPAAASVAAAPGAPFFGVEAYRDLMASTVRVEPALLVFAASVLRRDEAAWGGFDRRVRPELLARQLDEGYWTADGTWECDPGGDIAETALAVLALQAGYR